jgi:hypothetical protein
VIVLYDLQNKMEKRKTVFERIRANLTILLIISQALGILGAIMFGSTIDSGFSGYLIGYVIGVIFGLGGTIGFS